MIARFHYDEETLSQWLHDRHFEQRHEVTEHVETCAQCQLQLETLTQVGLTLEEAGELLRSDEWSEGSDVHSIDTEESRLTTTLLKSSDHPDSLGRLGRYEIIELLGRGGMGIVMRGYDPALNRHSAIKILSPELASSAASRRRFSQEAKSAAAVVHPHVVPIQTVDQHDGIPYLVMPVVEGQSLQQRVDQDGPLDVVELVRIAAQVCEGLAAAHAQGLVHRDIKPANILLDPGVERVQITDFGLARAADDASLTRSGVIAGTPQYMSPEQAHGDFIDHRSDLFSVGSLIYFMSTGRSPFRAETTMGVLHRIVHDDPKPIRSINAEIPEWLQRIVSRLLSKDPGARYASAGELAELLNRWLAHLQTPESVAPPEEVSPPRLGAQRGDRLPPILKTLIAAGGAGAVLLLTVVFLLEYDKGTIRIENNSQREVPIRIQRGATTVQTLKVAASGASTRIRAGDYSVEVDGDLDGFELIGEKVVLNRGGDWIVRIEHIPRETEPFPASETSVDSDQELTWADLGDEMSPSEFREELKLAQRRVDQVSQSIQRWRERVQQWAENPDGVVDGKPIANSRSIDDAKESQKMQEASLKQLKRDQYFMERRLLAHVDYLRQESDTAAKLFELSRTQNKRLVAGNAQDTVSPDERYRAEFAVIKAASARHRIANRLELFLAVVGEFGIRDADETLPPGQIPRQKVTVIVYVDGGGKIQWEGRDVSLEELCQELSQLNIFPELTTLQFAIDPSVHYQRVIEILTETRKVPLLKGVPFSFRTHPADQN